MLVYIISSIDCSRKRNIDLIQKEFNVLKTNLKYTAMFVLVVCDPMNL